MSRTILEGGYLATVDGAGTEFDGGYLVFERGRITALGSGRAPDPLREGAEIVDARGCLITPGLINTHHHLYQWLTRGWAQDSILFDWLVALYPAWSRIDADLVGAGSAAAMAVLARSGCTLVGDHHYVFPQGSGDILGSIVDASSQVGVRLHATRGSMDLGRSQGGLPPDFAVETADAILSASSDAVTRFHDPSGDARVQIALAPCSPFSVTSELLRDSALLARELGVRLHTHGSETIEEEAFCLEKFGAGPTDYLEGLGWLGDDVWMAHCVHLRRAATSPSSRPRARASRTAPPRTRAWPRASPRCPHCSPRESPVGLGVDGAASNESGQLGIRVCARGPDEPAAAPARTR